MRLKLIGVSLLLCVALAGTVFAAADTVRAYQNLQQDRQRNMASDVSTVRPWMTLPYISRTYHVPIACLYGSLHISASVLQRHATLSYLASYYHKPINDLIHKVQGIIQDYRKKRMVCGNPGINSRAFSRAKVFGSSWAGDKGRSG